MPPKTEKVKPLAEFGVCSLPIVSGVLMRSKTVNPGAPFIIMSVMLATVAEFVSVQKLVLRPLVLYVSPSSAKLHTCPKLAPVTPPAVAEVAAQVRVWVNESS